MTKPQLIFVCSPFRATAKNGLAKHIDYAKAACRQVFEEGDHPFAPHLLYPSFLNDHSPADRERGIAAGLTILSACDALYVFTELGVSAGMEEEISFAGQRAIPVVFRNLKPALLPLEEKSSQSQKTY